MRGADHPPIVQERAPVPGCRCLTRAIAVRYPVTFLVEARRPILAGGVIPDCSRGAGERGRHTAEAGAGRQCPGGWGARLIPAHCHPDDRRPGGALSRSNARHDPRARFAPRTLPLLPRKAAE